MAADNQEVSRPHLLVSTRCGSPSDDANAVTPASAVYRNVSNKGYRHVGNELIKLSSPALLHPRRRTRGLSRDNLPVVHSNPQKKTNGRGRGKNTKALIQPRSDLNDLHLFRLEG
jgi:hypothetical protein